MAEYGGADNQRQLHELVERFRARLHLQEDTHRAYLADSFSRRLAAETKRCGRYNHRCSVIVLASRQTSPQSVCNTIRDLLRETDIVGVIRWDDGVAQPEPGADRMTGPGAPTRVATVLPETDRQGAAAMVCRLKRALDEVADLELGVSVCPDDSSDPDELLRIAAANTVHLSSGPGPCPSAT